MWTPRQTPKGEYEMRNESNTAVSGTECAVKIHAVIAQLLAAGHEEEVVVDAVMDELYGELFKPNIIETMTEECRRALDEAFGGTHEECVHC
jgi:hypothetical protein